MLATIVTKKTKINGIRNEHCNCNYDNDYYGDQKCIRNKQDTGLGTLVDKESIMSKLFLYYFMH